MINLKFQGKISQTKKKFESVLQYKSIIVTLRKTNDNINLSLTS